MEPWALNTSASTNSLSVINLSSLSVRFNCETVLSFTSSLVCKLDVNSFSVSIWKEDEMADRYLKSCNTIYSVGSDRQSEGIMVCVSVSIDC